MADLALQSHHVHLWRTSLVLTPTEECERWLLLSLEERKRAERFRFTQHKQRFIAARGLLRLMLGWYLDQNPQDIQILSTRRGKPYVTQTSLRFNLSHSDDMAVYAVTKDHAIGVDIEKIRDTYEDNVARRFFSATEYAALMARSEEKRALAFYTIWSRKEAIVKAMGEGMAFSLSSFSVSLEYAVEELTLDTPERSRWHLESFVADSKYQSAFATEQSVSKILYLEWGSDTPILWNESGSIIS